MVERLLVWEKWREDRGVVAKECEQYAERLGGYVRKRLLILIRRVVVRRSTYDVYCGRGTNGVTAVNSAYYGRRTMNFAS